MLVQVQLRRTRSIEHAFAIVGPVAGGAYIVDANKRAAVRLDAGGLDACCLGDAYDGAVHVFHLVSCARKRQRAAHE